MASTSIGLMGLEIPLGAFLVVTIVLVVIAFAVGMGARILQKWVEKSKRLVQQVSCLQTATISEGLRQELNHEVTWIENRIRIHRADRLRQGREDSLYRVPAPPKKPDDRFERHFGEEPIGEYPNSIGWPELGEEAKKMLAMEFEGEGKELIESFEAEFKKHEDVDLNDIHTHVFDPLVYATKYNKTFDAHYLLDLYKERIHEVETFRRIMSKENVQRLRDRVAGKIPLLDRFKSCLVVKARYPEVRFWCKNAGLQEFECFLHQTYMDDLRLQVLFGQAPTPAQFSYCLSKIWEYDVAVVVSIGENKRMIDPYFSLEEGGHQQHEQLVVLDSMRLLYKRTDRILEFVGRIDVRTKFVADYEDAGYIHYGIEIETDRMSSLRRNIDILHIYEWPDNPVPAKTSALAEIIRHVDRLRAEKHTKKWRMLPCDYGMETRERTRLSRDFAIMVHCEDGRYRSPAFAAMLVANHRITRTGKVSVMEILRRIRRLRYHAWHGDARKAFGQFQLVFAVSALLMEMETKSRKKLSMNPRVTTAAIVEQALLNQDKQSRSDKAQ